ncbi:MAG: insulinase family protein [Scytolyngbya sp. HA4215-MV1]|nr:insulinase family protein [Scytolyngbya sp. HA4215-MV1]
MRELKRKIKRQTLFIFSFSLSILAGLLLIGNIRPAFAETAKHYTELSFPPLPEVQVPAYTKFQTKNGIRVFLMEDHELPLVSGTALFRTGERLEPIEQTGLAAVTGTVLRSGGTLQRSADQLNQALEQRAASIETDIDLSSGQAGFNVLSKDLDEVFDLFAEVIQQPAFAQDKIDLEKNQQKGTISRRNDDPGDIGSREFQKLVYGATSPYARTVEYATLENFSRPDIIQFYQKYFTPNTMVLGIVGDFNSATMRSQIEAKFGTWQPNPTQKPTISIPPAAQAKDRGLFFVNQPHLSQSYVQMGHLGGMLSSPDYPALSVMNEVLNGFGGRLFNEVRSRQGLAYSVYGVWSPRYDYPGLFLAGGETRSDATVPFIRSILTEIEKIRSKPISQTELAFAQDSVLNSFVFNFRDPAQVLSRLLRYTYYGYPEDFLLRYQKAVKTVTVADVQRVAAAYLNPQKIVTLVVGNASAIQPPLSSLGSNLPVTAIDITIPEPRKSNL